MTANFTICVGTVGSGAWTSADGGDSWQRVRRGLWGESRIYGLAVHPREPRTVFAGADDGVYKSLDGGQSFERFPDSADEQDGRVEDRAFGPGRRPRTMTSAGTRLAGRCSARTMAGRSGKCCRSTWSRIAPMSGCRG